MKKTKPNKASKTGSKKSLLVTVETVRDLATVTGGMTCDPTMKTKVCNPSG